MTLSDPLLKELKGHIAKLVLTSFPPYGDDNETVFLLCHCLESIFVKGLIRHDGFTPWRTDSFSWFYQLVRKYHRVIPLAFKLAFEDVLNDPKTRTQTGKTRLLIRSCLKRRCLHIPIQFHVDNQDFNEPSLRVNYDTKHSILGHEILSQIFLSLIMQLSNYDFNLDLSNSSFLDESWQIPQLIKAEFVPCDKLGLTLGFPMGFAVIADIIENSLAAELEDKIAVGDILDDFNGTAVRNFYGPKIESLFRKNRSQPFKITFIKATDSRGQLYLPAIKLYRILGLDPERLTYTRPKRIDLDQQLDLELNIDNESEHEDNFRSHEIHNPPLIEGLISDEPQNPQLLMPEESHNAQLIEGLLPYESQSTQLIPHKSQSPQISQDELPQTSLFNANQHPRKGNEASMKPSTTYSDILAELSRPLECTSSALLDLDLNPAALLDLSPPLQVMNEWDKSCSQQGIKPESSKSDEYNNLQTTKENFQSISNNKNEQRATEKSDYPKYYDDSNPCMV